MTGTDACADVIVVGAGPVGLLLAGDLRRGGANVVVLERLAAPAGESRASQLNARTMELFDQRGLLGRLGPLESEGHGHFGGLGFSVRAVSSEYPGYWKVPQYRTEAVLEDWAAELGAVICRSHEVHGLRTHREHVEVAAGTARLRARYVVGCDGERSTVRRLAGFAFPGRDAMRELLRADVAGIDVPDRRFERTETGLAIAGKRPGGLTRIMLHEHGSPGYGRAGDPTFDEVAKAWARVTGEDISGGKPVWVNAFGDACRQAASYREGRVLLAGDAAHVQLPVGGQALNLGLQDAANLGWKLAAHVAGWAPAGLLDTYHDERHPVGCRILGYVAAQALLLLGDRSVEPLRAVFSELLGLGLVRAHLAAMSSGLDIRYDVGPSGHALLGARLPCARLATASGPAGTAALLRTGRGLFLTLDGDRDRVAAAARWRDRVDCVTATPEPGGPLSGLAAVLVRPDGHVVWTGPGAGDPDAALFRWFGVPQSE